MGLVRKLSIVLGASLLPGAWAQAEEAPLDPRSAAMLATHNHERERLGVPALRWNAALARDAYAWADRLAQQGHMVHSSHAQRRNAGENLWMGPKGYYSPQVMVGTFLDERQYFKPGNFPDISTTGNWYDVGHYSQVIWRDTREVGCAIAEGPREEFLVCRYWPAGNFWGQPVY